MSGGTRDRSWDDDHPLTTLSFVAGLSRAEVAHVLQADVSSEWLAQVGEDDGWVVLQELHGTAGIHPSLTRPLSHAGRLVALHHGINAEMQFRYAVAGELTRVFDPLTWPDEQQGEPLPEEEGLVFGLPEPEDNPFQQVVELTQRLTGLRLTDDWVLRTPRATLLAPTFYDP